jgi:pimeloyl-ACP methyl ester carboxylesterase
MAASSYIPQYHNVSVEANGLGTFHINYIEAGAPTLPTVLLLHGFPSSSTQYRDFIPLLSNTYHVLAPDLPGFGLTKSPPDMKYNFDNLAAAISAWLLALNITSYAVYIFDYGAPVGQRLALQNPESIKAIISQNGNSYDAGFGHPFWNPIMALWKSNDSAADREVLRENVLTLATTKYQYEAGVPEADYCLINPVQYNTDYLMNIAGKENQEHQLDLFYDYRTNVALYPKVHEYFRKSQVPLLAVWGKGDPAFIPPGAEAYKTDLPKAEVHLLDAGHFALETKRWEIARILLNFLSRNGF